VQYHADPFHSTPPLTTVSAGTSATGLAVIHERLVLEAKRRLFYAHEPIKEIAYRLAL
jgi:AraC-like DNA-binding protein